LHRGHIEYIREAKSLGDILIIGLNSDKSVKKIKGNHRPVNSQEDRAIVLSALKFVDYVVIFDEETPYELIKTIIPDVLVKGGDWKTDEIVGNDIVTRNGGIVKSLKFIPGQSTSGIINKIQNLKE